MPRLGDALFDAPRFRGAEVRRVGKTAKEALDQCLEAAHCSIEPGTEWLEERGSARRLSEH